MTQEEWLKANTFYCELQRSRISKQTCFALQVKAKVQANQVRDKNCFIQKSLHLEKCLNCKQAKGIEMPPSAQKIEKLPEPQMKQCVSCKQWLPLDRFQVNSRAKDGLQSHCKKCMAEKIHAAKRQRDEICKTGGIKKSGSICIDFSEYPETWDRLKRLAVEEFRTPEMQALYLLCRNLPRIENER